MYKFNAANLSFYPYSLEQDYRAAGSWPETGVDVTDYVYEDFKIKPAPDGMTLGANAKGEPVWIPIPPPTQEELYAQAEAKRKNLIAECDSISVIEWNSMTPETQAEWVTYRKELVALPSQSKYPNCAWPVKPERA